MRSILTLLIVLVPVLSSANGFVEPVVDKYVEEGVLHGATLLAVRGEVVHRSANGLANVEWAVPNTTDTRFKIYSMSKQFTAVLVLQQAAAGKLELEDTVSEHLPWFRTELGERITIHQLLCHTSGIQQVDRSQMPYLIELPAEEAIHRYLSAGVAFEPGSQFEYSGLAGYTILGAILEAVSGQSFENLLHERILRPAGMHHTIYLDYHQVVSGKAEDYRHDGQRYTRRLQTYFARANGASSLVTTTGDLLRWDRALRDETLLPTRWRELLFTPHVTMENGAYGYGFYIWSDERSSAPHRFAYHAGGGSCAMVMDLDRDLTVVLLNNVPARNLIGIGFEMIDSMR